MRVRRSALPLALLAPLLIPALPILAGCGNGGGGAAKDAAAGGGANPAKTAPANAPAANVPAIVGDRVGVLTTTPGTGEGAKDGDLLSMRYTGRLKNGGKQFDSNAGGGKPPFNLVLGGGSVIKGWEEGLQGVKVGEKRTLAIPAVKGYADKGAGADIPPNADLVFDIECLSIVPKDKQDVLQREVTTPGTGKEAKEGSIVTFTYVGKLADGTTFDDQSAKPLSVKLGANRLDPAALEAAMVGLKAGTKVKLTLPPAVAFGAQGNRTGSVPANSVVIFDIDLKRVE